MVCPEGYPTVRSFFDLKRTIACRPHLQMFSGEDRDIEEVLNTSSIHGWLVRIFQDFPRPYVSMQVSPKFRICRKTMWHKETSVNVRDAT